ncbi:MAG TPA: response regulator [Bacteroidales bacterium]|nr:response regulator [Bacteroidales bacterium]HOK98254.1 response regulator [Bacteroidales bacterium]HPO65663.1 response regulator [Bacteroidales bacterium]
MTNPQPDIARYTMPGIFQNKTILIAEDDETNFFLLKEYLEFSKAEIIWAQNGEEAVRWVENNPDIDVVLMDIQMPVMDGNTAMKQIKKIRSNLPVIALTAYGVMGDRERGIREGFNEYATKPISRMLLIEILLRFI